MKFHPIFLSALLFLAGAVSAPAQESAVVLAVMPFRSIGESERLSLGESFSETLTSKLVGLRGLKVYERSQFAKIAGELALQRDSSGLFDESTLTRTGSVVGMDYMVVGSVTLAGKGLACQIRLVRVRDGQAVLSRQFTGAYPDDVFDLQDSVALSVVDAMSIRMNDLEKRNLSKKPTNNVSSWELYNKSLGNRGADERIALLERALEADPAFAQAANLLADLYAEKGDLARAALTYESILAQDPEDFRALYNGALIAFDVADMGMARGRMERCLALKPGDPDILFHLGLFSEFGEDGERFGEGASLAEAYGRYREALALAPNHRESLEAAGMLALALAQAEAEPEAQLAYLERAVTDLASFAAVYPEAECVFEIKAALDQARPLVGQLREYLGRN